MSLAFGLKKKKSVSKLYKLSMGDGRFKEEIHVSTSNTLNVHINLKLEIIPVCQFSYLKGSNAIMDRIQIQAKVSAAIFQEDHG